MITIEKKSLAGYSFIDLFAGLGGFRIALESLGAKCVYSNEWNVPVQKVYADTFARLKNEVEVHVRPESLANMNRLLQKGVRTGKVRIRAGK